MGRDPQGLGSRRYINGLRDGEPRIEVWPTRDRALCVTPFMLEPGQKQVVGRRLVDVFESLG
ncbi:MAG: hypothetical protein ACRD2N_07495 [Vicinamibacterales bacterium]